MTTKPIVVTSGETQRPEPMSRGGLIATLGPIRQIAWLTEDLEASIAQWQRIAGVGPWDLFRNLKLVGSYRGAPVTITFDGAFSYQDGVQIEIIRPHGSGPSPYHDEKGRVRVGMHHIAWLVEDIATATDRARADGLQLLVEGEGDGPTRIAYLQAPDDPAMLFEMIEATPLALNTFESGAAASRTWDGISRGLELDFGAG